LLTETPHAFAQTTELITELALPLAKFAG